MPDCVVYWLFDASCRSPKTHGYVGVSRDWSRRVGEHRRSRQFPEFKSKIIFSGTLDACLREERRLRPRPSIGWNNGAAGAPCLAHSERTRERMRLAHVGKKFTMAHRRKISAALTGKRRTPEHLANSSKALKGKNIGNQHARGYRHTEATKNKISRSLRGRKRSPESLAKASEKLKGRAFTAEHRAKLSAAAKRRRVSVQTRKHLSRLFKGRQFSKVTRKRISEGVERAKARKRAEQEQANDDHGQNRRGDRHCA